MDSQLYREEQRKKEYHAEDCSFL